jgi:hypothetical protein
MSAAFVLAGDLVSVAPTRQDRHGDPHRSHVAPDYSQVGDRDDAIIDVRYAIVGFAPENVDVGLVDRPNSSHDNQFVRRARPERHLASSADLSGHSRCLATPRGELTQFDLDIALSPARVVDLDRDDASLPQARIDHQVDVAKATETITRGRPAVEAWLTLAAAFGSPAATFSPAPAGPVALPP